MSKAKGLIFNLILWVVFGILAGRLVLLQVIEGKHYRILAEENRVQLIKVAADRGVIYDRYGEVLVRNAPGGREYVYGPAAAQVLGYVGEVSEKELEQCEDQAAAVDRGAPKARHPLGSADCYAMGDVVGKMGIEKEYDAVLRGRDGGILVEKDAAGEVKREIGRSEPEAGKSLHLTLDAGLQRKAYELLAGRPGAVVASIPETGEILALVSSPGFDPNLFGLSSDLFRSRLNPAPKARHPLEEQEIKRVLTDPDLPMFNRAIGGEYPPGSVFKIITATAALEEGKADETTEIEDTGEIRVGPWRFGNWYFDQYGKTEGVLGIVRAISRSNDIFFYKLGEWLGIRGLADWAKYFGLGFLTGIDLPGEAYGLMPDPEWKKEYKGEDWYLGDTYISAIGQGNILMTPLQVNQMASVIASGGQLCQPHVNKALEVKCQKLDISEKTLNLVTEGLKQVCEPGGTAWPFFNFQVKGKKVAVAGKTGTAEFGHPEDKTHAWFTAFAPAEKPEIVVTVLLEEGGEGSYQAAPVAKELLSYWFGRQ